ncbi:MAG: hypothetical protein JWR80_1043 [Bradyrhizobium sp.]|nr:hypothetical protein [Bradyrhizobium sp.]
MAKLKQQHEPLNTIFDLFASGDPLNLYAIYRHMAEVAGGRVCKVPLTAKGYPDWRQASIDTLLLGDETPTDMRDLERYGVRFRDVAGCAPETEVVIYFTPTHGDAPCCRLLAGPPADKDIAYLVVCRNCDIVPRMRPYMADLTVEPPASANDNKPDIPTPAMHPEPFTPEAAGGLLERVAEWITSTAIIPVPELSLVSSIALLAGMFGGKALGPTNSGINLYITTLLATAGGKGHPPKAIRNLSDKAGTRGAVTNGDPTSYPALERMLRQSPSTVVTMDEFGVTLQDVNAKNRNSVAASIRKFLLAIYDQANSVFDGRIYASSDTKKDDGPLIGPALTVLGMTTVGTLYEGLAEASVGDGFLNRFLFVSGSRPDGDIQPPKLKTDSNPPAGIIAALQAAITSFPKNKLPTSKYRVRFEDDEDGAAYERWGQVFIWQHHQGWDEVERNINGRAAENTVRLATIRAISRDPAEPLINVEDVEWGWAIVHQSIALISDGIARHMSASPAEALRKSIIDVIRQAPDKSIAFSKLLMRSGVRGAQLFEVESALQWLVSTGELTDTNGMLKPGKGSKFRWNGRE